MRTFFAWLGRFVVLAALGLWLGGFTFYTSWVISVGHRHIPGGRFGFVTGEVTGILNALALIAGVLLLGSLVLEWKGAGRILRWGRVGTWALFVASLIWVHRLHAQLDGQMDYPTHQVRDRTAFDVRHERYELVSTLQWASGLLHLGFLLAQWTRREPSGVAAQRSG